MREENYDFIFKYVLIGDSSVGKTNIMSKYLKGEFHHDSKATVGVEFGGKKMEIDGLNIKVQIWDTAGQERYKAITNAYYKGAKGAFIVYDITRKDTFDSVEKWIADLNASADKKISIVLIGNKSDLEDSREVTNEQGEAKAKAFGAAFLETSALTGQNLDKAFDLMTKEVVNKHKDELEKEDYEFGMIESGKEINLSTKPEEKKSCC